MVQVCEPMGLSDPRVALYLIVAALLLLPEVSELELYGVVTLRRRLEEAREEARELKEEITRIRTQASALSHANAASRTDINLNVRQFQTASALDDVTTGDMGPFEPDEEVGAYAQMAFQAGLAGLPQLLPAWGQDATLIGYTLGEDGRLERTYQIGDDYDDATLGDLDRRANQRPYETGITVRPQCWTAMAYAMDDGAPVGALAVLVPGEDLALEEAAGAGDEWETLAASAEAVARAYARLLIDLLNERPARSGTGKAPGKGGH